MSNAFKCDVCGVMHEGTPDRMKLRKYGSVGLTDWTDADTIIAVEACENCSKDIESELSYLIEGHDDE